MAMMQGRDRDELNYGGKIVMPPSALNKLTMLHITYPMLFQLTAEENQTQTFAGVLEFIAEEGRVYLPQWMMESLQVSPGSLIEIESVDLPSGDFVKIEPQSTDFLDISDPKAVLENALRNFSTLTVGDIFQINYNNKVYSIKVLEAKPESDKQSICVVETDLEVDFAPPVGYVDPSPVSSSVPSRATATPLGTMANTIGYEQLAKQKTQEANRKANPFSGGGQKLSGKSVYNEDLTAEDSSNKAMTELPPIDAPPLNLPFGQLFFGFPIVPLKHSDEEKAREHQENTSESIHFKGQGQSLRQSRKRKGQSSSRAPSGSGSRPRTASNSPEVIEID